MPLKKRQKESPLGFRSRNQKNDSIKGLPTKQGPELEHKMAKG